MYREKENDLPVRELQHPCLSKWRARIDWAEENDGFHADHRKLAGRWDMCAVGEARRLYGVRYRPNGRGEECPVDERLYELGGKFVVAVHGNNFAWARRLITAIEQRLAELA